MISVFRKAEGGEAVVCRFSERNAKLSQECMGKDEVSVQVTVDEVLPIRELDYIRVNGAVYTLNRMTDYDEVSDVEFRYQLIFEGVIYNLIDKMYVDVERNSDRFSLTATLQEFVDLLAVNMNSVDPGWSAGEIPETERKNLTFESVSCREVLNRLATEFGVEYYLKGRKICFADRLENHTSLVFERGKGKGLYKLTCKNADTGNTVTRVRVYGSTENLPVGYRDGQADRLQLPMEDGKPVYYLEDYSEFSKVVERTVHFDDVKPTFKGNVATVADEFNRRITCPEIDFDLNEVAVGDDARVNFLTGELTGVAFQFTWDNAKKELNLIRQEDQMALPDADGKRPLIPNAGKKANAGDRFNFTGISLPQAYVDRAEQELLAKGREWLSFYKQLRVNFGLEVDYRFLRESGYALHVGDVVTVKVPKLDMEKRLRVLSVDQDLNTGKLSCNVSNYLTESWEKKIEGQIQATQSSVDRVNLNAGYLVEATKEWVAQRFARLAGGNRFTGKQEVDGDVVLAADRRLSIGEVMMHAAKGVFRTVLSVTGKSGEDVEVEAAGMKAKRVTAEEVSTPDFVSGFLGSGARLKDSHLELDELTVRKRMNVYELMIEKVKSVGGNLIVSVGAAKVEAVTELADSFRCTFQNTGEGAGNPFTVDDQALCQTFGGEQAKRYWRRVVATGDGYFDLSKADCEAGSAVPEAGDEVVQLGNRTDRSRQSAILLCAVGADAPYTDHYDGIDGFLLAGKLVSREGKLTGIVDDVFGRLSGAGLYARNVYLRGSLVLSSGETVDKTIGDMDAKVLSAQAIAGTAQIDAQAAKSAAEVAALEASEANSGLGRVTKDIEVLMDAQNGFRVEVAEVREKAEAVRQAVDGLQIGGGNFLNGSRLDNLENWVDLEGTVVLVEDEKFGRVVEYTRSSGSGNFQKGFGLSLEELSNTDLVYFVIAKQVSDSGFWGFGGWMETFNFLNANSNKIDLGNGWYQYWATFKSGDTIGSGTFGFNSIMGAWRFYAAGVLKGNRPVSWSPSFSDQQGEAARIAQLQAEAERVKAEAYADGRVTAEEQRALQDAQVKYEAAVLEAERKALGRSWASGKMLYMDPTFKEGSNGVYPYNNELTPNVPVTRVGKLADSPVIDSDYNLEIKNIGAASPGLGGFHLEVLSRANAIFIARFIAKIPAGYAVNFATNSIGEGAESFWSTSNVGTGKWEEYIYVVKCGSEEPFSTTMFFYLQGIPGTPDIPVVWYLAYASVFDVSEGSNAQTDARDAFLEANRGKLFLRGTGTNREGVTECVIHNNGVDLLSGVTQSGANLVVIRRSDLAVLEKINYYRTWDSEVIGQSKVNELVEKLNSLDSSVIVCLASCDSMFGFADYTALFAALERCGASGSEAMNAAIRIPYALVGIPGIGKGNGIEVFTSSASDAPFAEISTQIVNGTPIGMSSAAAAAITVVKTELQTSIDAKPDRIELKIVEDNYNALGERVSGAESKIEQTARQISLLVKDDTSESGITIDPKRIEVTGETVFRNNSGDQIHFFGSGDDVFSINNGVFKVDKDGKATMTNCEITGGKFMDFTVIPGMMQTSSSTKGQITISTGDTLAPHILVRKIIRGQIDTGNVYIGGIPAVSERIILEVDNSDILHRGGTFKGDAITCDSLKGNAITCNSLNVSGSIYFTGFSKITNTNGWDRVLVNTTTGEIAYG